MHSGFMSSHWKSSVIMQTSSVNTFVPMTLTFAPSLMQKVDNALKIANSVPNHPTVLPMQRSIPYSLLIKSLPKRRFMMNRGFCATLWLPQEND